MRNDDENRDEYDKAMVYLQIAYEHIKLIQKTRSYFLEMDAEVAFLDRMWDKTEEPGKTRGKKLYGA